MFSKFFELLGYYKLKPHRPQVKMVLEPDAKTPFKKDIEDMGYDLHAYGNTVIPNRSKGNIIKTGVKLKLPKGYGALVVSRSGIAVEGKTRIQLGVIDSNYTGEIGIIADNDSYEDYPVKHRQRLAQLLIVPQIDVDFIEVEDLPTTTRGEKGYGSSGR